jgi:hypothetical protein
LDRYFSKFIFQSSKVSVEKRYQLSKRNNLNMNAKDKSEKKKSTSKTTKIRKSDKSKNPTKRKAACIEYIGWEADKEERKELRLQAARQYDAVVYLAKAMNLLHKIEKSIVDGKIIDNSIPNDIRKTILDCQHLFADPLSCDSQASEEYIPISYLKGLQMDQNTDFIDLEAYHTKGNDKRLTLRAIDKKALCRSKKSKKNQ